MKPDFTKYTYFELIDALKNIDRNLYPESVEIIEKEIDMLRHRFPFLGTPGNEFKKDVKTKSLWDKFLTAFAEDDPVKEYGGIDAYVSAYPSGKLHASSVSAYMIEENGLLYLVLRGYYGEGESHEAVRLKVNATGLKRLKEVIEQAEFDIRRKDLTSGS